MNPQSNHKLVSLDELVIDPRVQRAEGVDQRRVNTIAANFNPLALGTVTVSQRSDGRLILIDGAHRTAAARQAGYTGLINAEVITGLTIEQEADLFLLLNATATPSAISKFLVRIIRRDPAVIEMNDILAAHGWKVATNTADGVFAAVVAMERVYSMPQPQDMPQGHTLDRCLGIITAAWEHDCDAVSAPILEAVGQLLYRFGPSVDDQKLVDMMAETRPKVLIGRAKTLRDAQGGTLPAALAKILAGMHNHRRRTNLLPDWVWIR